MKKFKKILLLLAILCGIVFLCIPAWIREAQLPILHKYFPHGAYFGFIFIKVTPFFLLFVALFLSYRYLFDVLQQFIHLFFKQKLFLLFFVIMAYYNVNIYPIFKFPNFNFAFNERSTIPEDSLKFDELFPKIKYRHVQQKKFLLYYMKDEKTRKRAHEYYNRLK